MSISGKVYKGVWHRKKVAIKVFKTDISPGAESIHREIEAGFPCHDCDPISDTFLRCGLLSGIQISCVGLSIKVVSRLFMNHVG